MSDNDALYDLDKLIAAQCENVVLFDKRIESQQSSGDALEDVASVDASTVTATIGSVFSSYIIPPSLWQLFPTSKMRERWMSLRIPPSVNVGAPWLKFSPVRLAYIDELGQSAQGVRGPFSVTHWGSAAYGIKWVIAKPMDPALYNYFNNSLGQAESRFALLARNVFWMAAVIGGFSPDGSHIGEQYNGPHFYVHYNDGRQYSAVVVPWESVIERARQGAPKSLLVAEFGADEPEMLEATTGAVGNLEPLPGAGDDGTLQMFDEPKPGEKVGQTVPVLTKGTSGAVTESEPLINPSFWNIDMNRFWPQFFFALDVALPFYSAVGSANLLNTLRKMDHWPLLKAYIQNQRGQFNYVAPDYKQYTNVGRFERPDYQS